MSEPTVIRSEKDIANLKPGQSFIVAVDGLPDDPIELVESDAWAEVQKLETAALNKFVESDRGEQDAGLTVSITDTHVVIETETDTELELGGDVRAATVTLDAGKTTRRKLTDEGNGWVSVNGQKHVVPESGKP